ncbi:MAG: hypothetical protein ACJ766_19805, partial [Thermoleophilaceae bacterium]
MSTLARFVTGRRTKWLVPVIWIVLVAALQPLGSKLSGVTDDRTQSALPKAAESTAVLKKQQRYFKAGQTASGLIVYRRAGGLTAADKAKIAGDARRAVAALPLRAKPAFATKSELAYTTLTVPNDENKLADWGKKLRRITGKGNAGLKV